MNVTNDNYLQLNQLSMHYTQKKGKIEVFNQLDLNIAKGEFICILGTSGCGKTTLLNIIAGLIHQTHGEIVLKGKVLSPKDHQVAVVFQENALFPWLTVEKNIELSMVIHKKEKTERKKQLNQYLDMINLTEFAKANIHELSGGMKQRVAIARALAQDSELLLMDEPFSALDKITRTELQNELVRIWMETNKTIIFVTHSPTEALLLANRIIVMQDRPGAIKEILQIDLPRPRHVKMDRFNTLSSQLEIMMKKG